MAELVSLDEARAYLRLDSNYEDGLVAVLLSSATRLCGDVARLSEEQYAAVFDGDEDQTVYEEDALRQAQALCKAGTLYALAYLFEHREEADHHGLTLTLRSILFSLREDKVQ